MANRMLERLRDKDKKGLFNASQVSISYPTGFLPFDYLNGYEVKVMDRNEHVIDTYATTGIRGGTFVTVIGKSGVAKTTWVIQTAYNIVKDFDDDAFVMIFDLEQALNYTRIKNVTGASQQDLDDKIVLRQEKNYIEDIFDTIIAIANDKEANKKEYTYDTKCLDEFGNPIIAYVPTVIIIDSIPTLSCRESDDEMKGGTDAARMAKAIKQFYSKLMPIVKTYNITVFTINHINAKIEINAFTKTQPQVMYLKQDESLPGGVAPIYYADTLVKFVSSTKFKDEDDGFDGFMVRAELIKSRSNKANKSCNLIYNQENGFDPIMTLYQFALDNDLIDGRNPYRYFKSNKDVKFDSRKFRKEFYTNEELQLTVKDATQPLLTSLLSAKRDDDENKDT